MHEPSQSLIILYQTEDGRTRVQCRFEDKTIWLTQAQIAELFQTTAQNVTLHLKTIFAEGELVEEATCKDYLQVRREIAAPEEAEVLNQQEDAPLSSRASEVSVLARGHVWSALMIRHAHACPLLTPTPIWSCQKAA